MKTGAEIVYEWFKKYSEQNGTPTPSEILAQLEMAIENERIVLPQANVIKSVCECGEQINKDYNDCCSYQCWKKKYEQLNKPATVSSSEDTGGIDKYFDDLEKWENSFHCNECGCDKITDFTYDRTVANGEVWHCKHCKTETVVGNKPNEDIY